MPAFASSREHATAICRALGSGVATSERHPTSPRPIRADPSSKWLQLFGQPVGSAMVSFGFPSAMRRGEGVTPLTECRRVLDNLLLLLRGRRRVVGHLGLVGALTRIGPRRSVVGAALGRREGQPAVVALAAVVVRRTRNEIAAEIADAAQRGIAQRTFIRGAAAKIAWCRSGPPQARPQSSRGRRCSRCCPWPRRQRRPCRWSECQQNGPHSMRVPIHDEFRGFPDTPLLLCASPWYMLPSHAHRL